MYQVCVIRCLNVKKQPSICLSVHNTCFGTLYSVSTHHRNLPRSLVKSLWAVWPVLFHSPMGEATLTKTNSLMQLKSRERIWEKNESEWTRKVEIRTGKKFLSVGGVHEAIFWPTPGFKRRTFVSSGFLTDWTLVSVFAVTHWVIAMHYIVQFQLPKPHLHPYPFPF